MKRYVRLLAQLCLAASLVSLLPARASAWGGEGHRIVARIAWARLQGTPTLAKVKAILGDSPQAFLDAATWPDSVRGNGPYSYANDWHFVSIPRGKNSFEPGYCAGSNKKPHDKPLVSAPYNKPYAKNVRNCVLGALDYSRATLRDPGSSRQARLEALKFIVHFIGDLHQPFHTLGVGRGGNDVDVRVFGEANCADEGEKPFPCNLHAVWDSRLIARRNLGDRAYVAQLQKLIVDNRLSAQPIGTPVEWAEQSWRLARAALVSPGANLDAAYYRRQIAVIDGRLALAGVRLAAVLNRALITRP
jgi:hypothetical protein